MATRKERIAELKTSAISLMADDYALQVTIDDTNENINSTAGDQVTADSPHTLNMTTTDDSLMNAVLTAIDTFYAALP